MKRNRPQGPQKGWMFPGTAPKNVRERRQQRLAAAVRSGRVRRLDPNLITRDEAYPLPEPIDPVFDKIAKRIRALESRKAAYGETADDALATALRLAEEVRSRGK